MSSFLIEAIVWSAPAMALVAFGAFMLTPHRKPIGKIQIDKNVNNPYLRFVSRMRVNINLRDESRKRVGLW